jgi:Disulfide bond chaperones of the HSP33 family
MDRIIKALAFDKSIRIYVADSTETVQEIKKRQQCTREVTAALGRLATATAMIGAMESFQAKTYIKIAGGGPVGLLYADSDAFGHVRAYATNPLVQLPATTKGKLNVGGVVGKQGFMTVIRDLGLKDNFSTQVPLVSGELGEDFAQFFAVSEQIPSAVGLGVLTDDETVKVAGGFIAQVLPDCSDETISALEANINKIPALLPFLQEHSVEELLNVLSNETAEILETMPLSFSCACSKKGFITALSALPKHELANMLETPNDEEIICQYCGQRYLINNKEIEEILTKL